MNISISILTAAICFGVAYAVFDNQISGKLRILRPANQEEAVEQKYFGRRKSLLMAMLTAVAAGVGCFFLFEGTGDIIHILKLLLALICLVGSGCMDYKEHRIPNIFSLVLAVSNVFWLAVGYFTEQDGALSFILCAVYSTVGVVVLFTAASFLTHGGIGAGDIKLLAALALAGDIYLLCGTLFFAVVLCALAGIVLLIRKKKTTKDGVPLGPFLLAGYLISLYIQLF